MITWRIIILSGPFHGNEQSFGESFDKIGRMGTTN